MIVRRKLTAQGALLWLIMGIHEWNGKAPIQRANPNRSMMLARTSKGLAVGTALIPESIQPVSKMIANARVSKTIYRSKP